MSERYGCCRTCRGSGYINNEECMCGGTGFSGDVMDYMYPAESLRISSGRGKAKSDKPIRYESLIQLAVSAMVPPKNFGRK